MHSLFKSYKTIRYPNSNIFEKLTEVMLEKIEAGNCDEQLMCYAVNRLAMVNERE